MKTFHEIKQNALKDPVIGKEYENLKLEYKIIEDIIRKRIDKGLTQKILAERIGTKQSAIARFESGKYNPSVAFLQKVAHALGGKLSFSIT